MNADPDSEAGDQLDVLAALVEVYERKHFHSGNTQLLDTFHAPDE